MKRCGHGPWVSKGGVHARRVDFLTAATAVGKLDIYTWRSATFQRQAAKVREDGDDDSLAQGNLSLKRVFGPLHERLSPSYHLMNMTVATSQKGTRMLFGHAVKA